MPNISITDTHCHLTDDAFGQDVEETIGRAKLAGVDQMVLACVDEKDFINIEKLYLQHQDCLIPTIGIHPENMAEDIYKQLAETLDLLQQHPEIQAIGEIGLDLYWDKSRLQDQILVLKEQIKWAVDRDLPILFHIRNAITEFIEVLSEIVPSIQKEGKMIHGILHCYSGTPDEADELIKYGDFFFGVGGTSTYKKSTVPDCIKHIGLERLVLETDAPYLSPIPFRGKRNEPAYTIHTASKIAEILGLTVEIVANITTKNAHLVFKNGPKTI